AGEQRPKPGRLPPLPRLTAPPFAPGSTADGAQLQPHHPLQGLLLDSPEGPSFAQRARLDYTPEVRFRPDAYIKTNGSRLLTLAEALALMRARQDGGPRI